MNDLTPQAIVQASAETAVLQARIAELENALAAQQLEIEIADLQMLRAYNFLLSTYQVVPGLLFVVDDQGIIRRANPEAGRLLGSSELALRGQRLVDLMDGGQAEVQALLQHPDRPAIRREVAFLGANHEWIPVYLSMRATRLDDEDRVHLVAVGVDLRERRQLEISLRHAQKLESVGQLTAGIAHEINTPMQFIVDHMGFLSEGVSNLIRLVAFADRIVLPNQQQAWALEKSAADFDFFASRVPKAIDRINEGVKRVTAIVNGMRTFAHPGVRHEMADLNQLVESSLLLAGSLYRQVARLDCQLAPDLPQVPCIPGDIGQVVVNLVSNAAHAVRARHGADDGGWIRLSTRLAEDRKHVLLICEDNGHGVPADVQHRIFDPFFTTKAVGEGSGQGLSICQNIVTARHHGSLRHEALQPAGARFVVALPLA